MKRRTIVSIAFAVGLLPMLLNLYSGSSIGQVSALVNLIVLFLLFLWYCISKE